MKVPQHTSPEMFIAYLQQTLIPDLRASGSDYTADDFEEAVYWLQHVMDAYNK